MNGQSVPWEKGNVHFLSHALHYGTAVFEGIRCYNTENGAAIFRLEEHVERFFKSADTFGINIPYSKKQIKQAIIDTVKKTILKNVTLDHLYIIVKVD